MEVSIEEEIGQLKMTRPHVVILGAGASRAAFPNGERHGRPLPLMCDFSEIVPIDEVLRRHGIDFAGDNFEAAYSQVAKNPSLINLRQELEATIYAYFNSLELPDYPTIYDHLVLSLRDKDVIATFNWDPFLLQAVRRNRIPKVEPPHLLFLHGNVLAGYCAKDGVHGVRGVKCSQCGQLFSASRLIYPVAEKDYQTDPMISESWRILRWALKEAFMVTIFGYSAPALDVEAVQLLQEAWGSLDKRKLEQIEIIDIKPEEELVESWDDFIYSHHYEVHASVYDSWILNHPRRTGEAFINQYLDAKFIENNPVPNEASFENLWCWFSPLFEAEERAGA